MPKKVTTRKNKLSVILAAILLIILLMSYAYDHWYKDDQSSSSQTPNQSDLGEIPTASFTPPSASDSLDTSVQSTVQFPKSYLIDVPFTSQAPLSNWDSEHEDACEEASLIMLKYWIDKKKFYDKESADAEILAMLKYEQENSFGKSITISDLSTIAKDYYHIANLSTKAITSPDDIKQVIATGTPVIVGAAGKILPNPNFRNGGPNYHMLLIKGYDQEGFITNDPGTRKGESFYYKNDELFEAIHDWQQTNILLGEKKILFIKI